MYIISQNAQKINYEDMQIYRHIFKQRLFYGAYS